MSARHVTKSLSTSPFRFLLVLALVAGWVFGSVPRAQSGSAAFLELGPSGDLVEATSPWPNYCSKGYLPVRVTVTNGGAAKSLNIEVEAGRSALASKTVAAASGVSKHWIYLPAWDRSYRRWIGTHFEQRGVRLRVRIGAQTMETSGVARTSTESPTKVKTFVLLTDLPGKHAKPSDWVLSIGTNVSTHGSEVSSVQGARVAFDDAPPRFEAYTSLDTVVVDVNGGLPPTDVMTGVLRWVRLGGTVALFGRGATSLAESHPELEPWLEERMRLDYLGLPEDYEVYRLGQGRLCLRDGSARALETTEERSALQALLNSSSKVVSTRRADASNFSGFVTGVERNRHIGPAPTIVGMDHIPYRTLLVALTLFTLLIGPFNFGFVRRLKRPMLLLITFPALALLATFLILAFGMFSTGIDDKTAEYTYTVVDQRTNRASAIQHRSLWCSFSPDPFRPSEGSALIPSQGLRLEYETVGPRVEQTNGMELAGDILPVRRLEEQTILADRTFRGRLEFEAQDGGVRVKNGFEFPVGVLAFCDHEGKLHLSEEALEPGGSSTLVASAVVPLGDGDRPFEPFLRAVGFPDRPAMVGQHGLEPEILVAYREKLSNMTMVPNTYIAISESPCPLIDEMGLEPSPVFARHVYLGILEAGEAQ